MYRPVQESGISQNEQLPHHQNPFAMLVELALFVFCIYSFVVSNTQAVASACGTQLLNFLISRTVLVSAMSFLSNFFTTFKLAVGGWRAPLIMILLHVSMFVAGASIVIPAMSNEVCKAAMSNVDSSHAPLLGIAGMICFILDAITMLVIFLGGCVLLKLNSH